MKLNFYIGTIMLAVLVNIFAVTSAVAQQSSPVEQIRELNRSGNWEQAAQMAQSFLEAGAAKSNKEKCQTYSSLIYAQTRLGRLAQAETNQSAFDKLCRQGELPKDTPLEMSKPKPSNDGFWQTVEPSSVGINPLALKEHQQLCERTGADACIVIRQGKIVQELYSARYRVPIYAMSSTKSITGLLVGMLIEDGKIKSIDEPVCNYINQWCTGEKAQVTLRHLLSMTSGLPRMWEEGVASVGDKNPFVIKLPLKSEPGKTWNYSNEGVQMLSPILDKAAGEPIQDYARKRLFEPLGMSQTRFHLDTKGHAWTYADMETSARDFARIGLLMLNKGKWENRQIVSQQWIKLSTEPSQNLNSGYGLLWWLYENPAGFGAQGYLDTNLYVFPKQDLIVVRMQSKPIAAGQSSYEKDAFTLFNQMVK